MFRFLAKKIDHFIPLLILSFATLVAYNSVGEGIINYIDHNFPFNFTNHLKKLLFVWNDYIFLGFNQATGLLSNISYYFIIYIFEALGFDYVLLNRLEHILPIFCIIYFTYLFLVSLFLAPLPPQKKLLLVLPATFSLTNILSLALFTMGLTPQILAFSGIPLVLFGIRKYALTQEKKYVLLLAAGSFVITNFNLPYSCISMLLVIIFTFLFTDIEIKSKLKITGIFLLLWGGINFYWLLPMFHSLFVAPPYNMFESINNNDAIVSFLKLVSPRYTLDHLLQLTIDLQIILKQNNSDLMQYLASPWIIIVSGCAIAIIFIEHIFLQKSKNLSLAFRTTTLILIFLIFVFLAKGLSKPFGEIYQFLFDNSTFFKMFRDSMKWLFIPILAFIVLSSQILVQPRNRATQSILILFFIVYLLPWNFGLFGRLKSYEVPNYYFSFMEAYQKDLNNSNKRAIILNSKVGATRFEFDINNENKKNLSNNILKFISPIPVVDLFSNGGGLSFNFIKRTLPNLEKNDSDLITFQKMGATHIFKQNDTVSKAQYNYTDEFFEKETYGKLEVYKVRPEFVLPKLFLSGAGENSVLSFEKINPVKYKISLKNISKKNLVILSFLYTYDENWQLFLDRPNLLENCAIIGGPNQIRIADSYSSTSIWFKGGSSFPDYLILKPSLTEECRKEQRFFEGEEISYLTHKTIFDDSHKIINNYSNSWTIDVEYIKANYPEEFYKENPDGTLDIAFILYFKAQSYFYIGIIISLITIVALAGYLMIGTVLPTRWKNKPYKN